MKYHICGERNSGTNFLENLIQENFDCDKHPNGYCELGWKHGEKIEKKEGVIIICIIRNPYSWLLSCKEKCYQKKKELNYFKDKKWEEFMKSSWEDVNNISYNSIYEARKKKYNKWLDVCDIIIKYEELIANPESFILKLEQLSNCKRKTTDINIVQDKQCAWWLKKIDKDLPKNIYQKRLKAVKNIDINDLCTINKYFDKEFESKFNYTIETKKIILNNGMCNRLHTILKYCDKFGPQNIEFIWKTRNVCPMDFNELFDAKNGLLVKNNEGLNDLCETENISILNKNEEIDFLSLFNKYIDIKSSIKDLINNYESRYNIKDMIGIHWRSNDMREAITYSNEYANYVSDILIHTNKNIFLSTDDPEIQRQYANNNRIFFYETYDVNNKNLRKSKNETAIIDLILLSKCSFVYLFYRSLYSYFVNIFRENNNCKIIGKYDYF